MIQNDGAVINGSVDIEVSDDAVLTLGKDVNIRPFVSIVCKKRISIGQGTQIGPGARIVDFDHALVGLENIAAVGQTKEVVIGKYCWIGANAVILKGVVLGDGCVVGAGSVVTRSFNEGSIIVGNPGSVMRSRGI